MIRHSYEPRLGHGLRHDPFNAIVGPRPIGWVSTADARGGRNLAPYSFFNAFNYTPPIIGFASVGWKDTVQNIAETRVFGWNLATLDQAEAMNASSAETGPDADEFALAGLVPVAADLIPVPLVAGCPVSFECRLTQMIQLQDTAGATVATWLVLGEVVKVHIDAALLADGVYLTSAARPILRGGGPADYFVVTDDAKFLMKRPRPPAS